MEDGKPCLAKMRGCKRSGWYVCLVALISFAAGSLMTSRVMHLHPVQADSYRVFELMVYHTVPGKVPALESVFRGAATLQAKHNLHVVGYWIPNDDPGWENTFVYLVAHPSREAAEIDWNALHADPAFLQYRKAAAPLIAKVGEDYRVDEVYMRPADFSAMK